MKEVAIAMLNFLNKLEGEQFKGDSVDLEMGKDICRRKMELYEEIQTAPDGDIFDEVKENLDDPQ